MLRCRSLPVMLVGLAILVLAAEAEAQVWIGRGGGGITVQAPYAPRVSLGVGIPPVRPFLPRRRLALDPYYGVAPLGPRPAAPPAAPRAATPPSAAAQPALPTYNALRAMDDSALLNAAVNVTQQLDQDLARFDTGAQWRSYLRLPADALPPPTNNQVSIGFASLERTLGRYDTIAANSGFGMISELPSFDASRSALAEMVRRFGDRRPAAASSPAEAASEELPAPSAAAFVPRTVVPAAAYEPASVSRPVAPLKRVPALAAPTNTPDGEQSILVK